MIDIIVCVLVLLIFYVYFGYPVILFVFQKLPKHYETSEVKPFVTILITAYNEESFIKRTINSILELNYPNDKIEIIICSDASTDRTDDIILSYNETRLKLHRMKVRSGKYSAQKEGVKYAKGDIILLADASGEFEPNALINLIKHFSNPSVGSSVGRKIIKETGSSVAKGDGLYWRYESKLRHLETLNGSSWVGCEGGITAVRKNLLSFDYKSWIAQDYALCCRIYEQGYRNIYEPNAIVYEAPSTNFLSEFKRKIRVIVRGIQAFLNFGKLLNPFNHAMFSFQNISHRLLRWLVPFFLILLFIVSGLSDSFLINILYIAQILFYCIGLVHGILLMFNENIKIKHSVFSVPLYFTSMNLAALISWMLLFKKFDRWNRSERESS